jgi:ABC-type dipeptide/oligopeptide/nickel transport system permease component
LYIRGDDVLKDYIIKRLLIGVLLVFAVSILVFSMLHLMPGDPIDLMVDRKVSFERREALRKEYGLDRPLHEQYITWIKKIVTKLDFGISLRNRQPVWDMLKTRIPISLKLCGWTLFFEMLIAIPLGMLCAYKKDTFFDRFTVNTTLLLTAIPGFWISVLLILVFGVKLKWFPLSGYETVKHYILPIASGVLGSVAGTIRLTKTEVLDVLHEKYVITAYAKGLPKRTVLIKHVLRNALILITVLVFMSIPWLISGAVITERIFAIPGMGSLMINSIILQDYAVVQACVLIISILTVICNIISDIIIGLLDPRIRISISGGDR